MLHTTFFLQNLLINEHFEITRKGGGRDNKLKLKKKIQFSTNIQIKIFYTRFHQNRIINQDFQHFNGNLFSEASFVSIFNIFLITGNNQIKMFHTKLHQNWIIKI